MSVRKFDSFVAASKHIMSVVNTGDVHLVSFDIFDTVIFRRCSPEAVLHSVALFLDRELKARNIGVRHGGSLGAYHAAYAILVERNAANGHDCEVFTSDIYGEWVAQASGREDAELAELVRRKMREVEVSVCEVNPYIRPLLEAMHQTGVRVIYISDMYIGAECVSAVLEKCGLSELFDSGYVSGDHAALKRTGQLFKLVSEREGISPANWLHCGDNVQADGEQASAIGIDAIVVRDTRCIRRYDALHYRYLRWLVNPRAEAGALAASFAQALPGEYITAPEAYARRVLGPIYAAFIQRVVERSLDCGIEHVYFLAREGYFLKEIFDVIAGSRYAGQKIPQTSYLGVSRLTSLFLGAPIFGMREVSVALSNGPRSIANLFSSLRMDSDTLSRVAAKHGILDIDAILPDYFMSWAPFLALLDDPEIAALARQRHEESRSLLGKYLRQEGFFAHNRIAIVDVGWAGQIQDSLYRGCRNLPDCPSIFGFYLGMNLTGHHRKTPRSWMEWAICDQAHLEWNGMSALQFPQCFEAVTRSPHGTVIGYEEKGSVIEPILKGEEVPSRRAEMQDDGLIAVMQEGVLEYVRHYCTAVSMLELHAEQMLPYAKQMTGRMIRFPTAREAGYFLRLNNVSDLGAGTLYKMGEVIRLSCTNPRAIAQAVRSSFWKYGTLALTGRMSRVLQLLWNVRSDARALPAASAPLDHGIVFHQPCDDSFSPPHMANVGEVGRGGSWLCADIPSKRRNLAELERRGHRLVDAYTETEPLTFGEAVYLYVAWRLASCYAKFSGRHIPTASAEPIGGYFRQAFLSAPHIRQRASKVVRALRLRRAVSFALARSRPTISRLAGE